MQDNKFTSQQEQEEYNQFIKQKRAEEAQASVSKIEMDCLTFECDKNLLKEWAQSADKLNIGALVVPPAYVRGCVNFLGGDPNVALVAAVSYPYGGDALPVKVAAVKRAVKDGVDEAEVSSPPGMIKDGNFAYLKKECKKLKKAAGSRALRMVFECAYLTEKELIKAVNVAADAGVNCVRLNGASAELVATVKAALKGKCLIKADGAQSAAEFERLCLMGADTVACRNACRLAEFILNNV